MNGVHDETDLDGLTMEQLRACVLDLEAQAHRNEETIRELRAQVRDRQRIGMAIGIIMNSRRVDAKTAVSQLMHASNRAHRRVIDCANAVIVAGMLVH